MCHEPVEGNSTSPEATAAASDGLVNVQPKSTPGTNANSDAENSPTPPPGNTPEGRVMILTLEILRELVKDPEFNIRIAENEISHTSKGDALSKDISILQSTWFIVSHVAYKGLTLLSSN